MEHLNEEDEKDNIDTYVQKSPEAGAWNLKHLEYLNGDFFL